MTNPVSPTATLDLLELERARLFALLGRLLVAPPDGALLASLRALRGEPGSVLGDAYRAMAEAARQADPAGAEREYHALFTGGGQGALLPFASRYLTGSPPERTLAGLRATLEQLGVERAPGVSEPEDHLGLLCETMAGLIAGVFPAGPEEAAGFFARHMGPWATRCFADMEEAGVARFYRAVGALGRAAMEIEAGAAGLPA